MWAVVVWGKLVKALKEVSGGGGKKKEIEKEK